MIGKVKNLSTGANNGNRRKVRVGNAALAVITLVAVAGPCAVESREQLC